MYNKCQAPVLIFQFVMVLINGCLIVFLMVSDHRGNSRVASERGV